MRLVKIMLICGSASLAACAPLPDLEDRRTADIESRDFPEFIPLDNLPQPDTEAGKQIQADVQTRLARVQGKARAVRGPVLSDRERRKLRSRRTVVRGQVLSEADRARLGTKIP